MLGNKRDVKVSIIIVTLTHHSYSQAYQAVMDDIHCHERPQRVLALVHSGFGEGYTATKAILKQIIATVVSKNTENLPPNVNKLLNSEGRREELAKRVDGLISRLGHEKLVNLIKSANREEAQEPQRQSQRRCVIV